MSIEKVREYFKQYNLEDKILEFEVSSATVELAAKALNVEPARIAKTLSFKSEKGCILIVCAGNVRINNKKFKECFHIKAKMLTPEEVYEYTGHHIGGVCPFGISNNELTFDANATTKVTFIDKKLSDLFTTASPVVIDNIANTTTPMKKADQP